MRVATVTEEKVSLEASHLEDIRLASSKMTGSERRAFQAEMALKYCRGSARCAEDVFGWSRQAVRLGLHEKRSGIVGEENRLEWTELLREIRDRRRLPALDYEIAPQRPLDPISGDLVFLASPMQLNAHLLHEEDLLRLLDDLHRHARPLLRVRECTLERLPRGAAEGSSAHPRANLRAECQIDWITIGQPGPRRP